MPVANIRYFPPLGLGTTQKGLGEYFEDYATFVYKADVGDFQQKKSGYITSWVKTALVTQCNLMPVNDADCLMMSQQLLKAVKRFSTLEKTLTSSNMYYISKARMETKSIMF